MAMIKGLAKQASGLLKIFGNWVLFKQLKDEVYNT